MMDVPFNRLRPLGNEAAYVAQAMAGDQLSSTGPFARRCQSLLEQQLGGGTVLLTGSATAALEIAAVLADLGPGDEVILPSFTFVSTANAVMLRGATPVFAEIDPATMGLDPQAVADRVTPRSRAVIPVHYAGIACAIDAVQGTCAQHDLVCIEDAAHGLGASHLGRALGRIAPLAALSFHESKNIGCGEGGALIVNDPALVARARVLRDKGTNRHDFLQGRADRYTWVDLGGSLALAELPAAYLLGQLEHLGEVTRWRRRIWDRYAKAMAPYRARGQVRWADAPAGASHNGHIFYMVLETPAARDGFIAHMRDWGVQSFFHYVPLHLSPMGARLGYRAGDLPTTEHLAERLVRLPLFATLTEAEVAHVITAAAAFFDGPRT